MQKLGGMAFSDLIILETLKRLIEEKHPNSVISQSMISEASGVGLDTTQRALKRLMQSGQIVGEFRIGVGYRYRINNGSRTTETRR